MATFSLGTSGVTPGAPGVYINEQPGKLAVPAIAPFDTVYMLVETEEGVPVTRFPFNTPIAITSLNDYKELIRIGTSTVPEGRIPLLSYNCVNEFFQNSRVGDLRVVRVGTPNQIVELEFFPSATKLNSTDLPSSLQAGNKVYVQMYINGQPLVAGDGSTGFTSNGEYLGVPVTIPVSYIAGDEANNRRISAAMATAVAEAIESNPSIRSSVYVRSFGQLNDLDPIQFANSQNSFVSISSTTFNGNVSVVTEVLPVGSNFVFMQNAYDVENIVGGSVDLVRVPQDYTQCIATAFDGQQDQGYLITPTAYAQFDAKGRALVGAAAAAHCESNDYKWMALADPGPFLVTDVNEYSEYTPHKAAADLNEGSKYLIDNAIYKWIGNDVSYPKLTNQTIVFGQSAETAVNESANIVSNGVKVGLLDPAQYTINAVASAASGVFELTDTAYWPVTLPIQQVSLQASGVVSDFTAVYVRGFSDDNPTITGPVFQINTITTVGGPLTNGTYTNETVNPGAVGGTGLLATVVVAGGVITSVTITNGGNGYQPGETLTFTNAVLGGSTFVVQNVDVVQNISNTEVFVIAAPRNLITDADYCLNYVLLATNAVNASNVYNNVVLQEGSNFITQTPVGAIYMPNPSGDFALISYADPYWDIEVDINGQTSDLIENISGSVAGVNTLHLPGTLQDPTESYILNWVSRTFLNPATSISAYAGTIVPAGSASFNCLGHGLRSGQRIFFTQPVTLTTAGQTSNFVSATTKLVSRPYWVKVIDQDSFALSNSLANFTTSNFIVYPSSGVFSTTPTIFYTQMLGRGETTISPIELLQLPMVRGRKYGFDSNNIWNQALSSTAAPAGTTVANTPNTSVYLNNSSVILGEDQITPYGEDISSLTLCGYLPKLNLVDPDPTPVAALLNAYCVPTVDQFFTSEAYFVPAIDPIFVGRYSGSAAGTIGPVATVASGVPTTAANGVYNNVVATAVSPSTGTGLTLTITVNAGNITSVFVNTPGQGFQSGDTLQLPAAQFGATVLTVATLNTSNGSIVAVAGIGTANALSITAGATTAAAATYTNVVPVTTTGAGFGLVVNVTVVAGTVTAVTLVDGGLGYAPGDTVDLPTAIFGPGVTLTVSGVAANSGYGAQLGITVGDTAAQMTNDQALLNGCYFDVTAPGTAPDGTPVVTGDRLALIYNGSTYDWVVVAADTAGGDLTSAGQPCYGSQVELLFTPEQGVPISLWRFDAITSTEIIDDALRGVGFNGVPQAEFIEAGVDNVNRLYQDSQRYFNPFGFIAYYGPYIENGAGQWIPPSSYVTGVAVRRYRSEGYQFPPAGVKFQLADAVGTQIPINSAQQNLLNPDGCNAVRSLPGYPDTAVFIWGGRTRINPAVAEQRLYQFVNTRVILNVVYGSLRTAFDNQIFNVIDGFNVVYNQIVSVGNSILNQLYVQGALFGARPSQAFQVICDPRINPPEDLENGIVNAKVFVTPVPTLERIQIDLIRVAIGQMNNELEIQGLG